MEEHFHLFHKEEIGQLLAKNIASNRRRARINTDQFSKQQQVYSVLPFVQVLPIKITITNS